MEAKQFQGKTLQYLTIEPDNYDPSLSYPMIILLHGFGAHMGDLAGLASAIDSQGYVYVCPNAPIPFELGFGSTGYGWTPPRDERTPEDIERAVEMLATLVDEVVAHYRVEPGNMVLGGFSQGGMMTYRYGLPNPDMFRGLAALSASVPEPDLLREMLPASRSQPIFVSHGTTDHMISIRDGQRSRDFLVGEGYAPQYREYPMGHQITQDVLDDLTAWIHEVLAPAKSPAS